MIFILNLKHNHGISNLDLTQNGFGLDLYVLVLLQFPVVIQPCAQNKLLLKKD